MSPVGAGAGAVLGQGCFGTVSSMTYNGAPVAVKELSATTLDAASIGAFRCGSVVVVCCVVLTLRVRSTAEVLRCFVSQRTS